MGHVMALQVAGMNRGACERRLQTVLGRLDGVGQVDADHVTGQVRVRLDAARAGGATLARQAADRIGQAGLEVAGAREQVTS